MAKQVQPSEMSPVIGKKPLMLWEVRQGSPVQQGLNRFPRTEDPGVGLGGPGRTEARWGWATS